MAFVKNPVQKEKSQEEEEEEEEEEVEEEEEEEINRPVFLAHAKLMIKKKIQEYETRVDLSAVSKRCLGLIAASSRPSRQHISWIVAE